jgi:hypothetical protein
VTDTAWIVRGLLLDKSAARAQMAAAPAVLARYSWEDAANRTLQAIESGPAGR